jgi:cytochrome c556
MLRIAAAVAALAVGVTVAYAQSQDAVKERRQAMRDIAKAGGASFKMMKGEAPFDLATVQGTLKTVQEIAPKLKNMFPDASKAAAGSDGKPAIYSDRAGFNAVIDKWVNDAKNAAAAIKDEATFKAEYPKAAQNCGGCHKQDGGYAPPLSESFKRTQQPL